MQRAILCLVGFTLIGGFQTAWAADPTYRDIEYARADGVPLLLDIYLPPNPEGPCPVVVWIHGGGWFSNDKSIGVDDIVGLLDHGIAIVSINYRLSFESNFPTQIFDCKAAMRWVRGNAFFYGFNSNRVCVWGHSAGGQLAELLGASSGVAELEGDLGDYTRLSSRPTCVVAFSGLSDFLALRGDHLDADSAESQLFGFNLGDVVRHQTDPNYAERVATVRSASAINYVSSELMPFYLVHGTSDQIIEYRQTTILSNALIAAGVDTTVRLPSSGHNIPPAEYDAAVAFLDSRLNAPIPGDFDRDGDVDIVDLNIVLVHWGKNGATPEEGDLNGDTRVDLNDLGLLTSNFTGM